MSAVISNENGITTITVTHPGGGVSEVDVYLNEDDSLQVTVSPTAWAGYCVDVDDETVAMREKARC